jgi:hypothetical protein
VTNEDRFWEASIAEAVSGIEPPDLSAEILTRLNARETPRARPWRYVVEFAAAAVVVAAIGLVTGIIPWPSGTPDRPDPERAWAQSPGSRVAETTDGLELEAGWLVLKPGAPDVRRGEGRLTEIQGVVLARAGGAPSEAELAGIAEWLEQNGLEETMWKSKSWVTGVTLAVLVLSGSAVLDGQEVEAPEPEVAAAPEWHDVRSIMDVDNLPTGATHVRVIDLSAEILEFLAEVPTLEAISMHRTWGLRTSHLKALQRLENLTLIDLRDTGWHREAESPGYELLLELPKLRTAGVDFDGRNTLYPGTKELAESGIEVWLGYFDVKQGSDEESHAQLERLFAEVPTVTRISVNAADNEALRLLSEAEGLTHLKLRGVTANEYGFARVARSLRLKSLHIRLDFWRRDRNLAETIPIEWLHHISRIQTLEELSLSGPIPGDARAGIAMLARLPNVRRLRLAESVMDTGSGQYWRSALKLLPPLETLELHRTAFDDPRQMFSELPVVRAENIVLTGVPVDEILHSWFWQSESTGGPRHLTIVPADWPNSVPDAIHRTRSPNALKDLFGGLESLERVTVVVSRHVTMGNAQALIDYIKEAAGEGVEVTSIRR